MTGFSIGDGNLTNPNGRATRLRVTCDKKYPELKNRIVESLRILFPENRVSEYVRKENCTVVYTYINFTTIIERLKNDVLLMIEMMGYKAKWYKIFQKKGGKYKYVIRIAKNARNFIDEIGINKK